MGAKLQIKRRFIKGVRLMVNSLRKWMDKEKYALLFALVAVAVVIVIYIIQLHELSFASTPDSFGTFGDYIGGVVGAIAGLVSIFFLYITYSKQIEIFKKQKEDSDNLRFEQVFFKLLDNFRNVLTSEKPDDQQFISSFRSKLQPEIDKICDEKDSLTTLNSLETRKKIDTVYQKYFIPNADKLGHYFRSLYHLLKFIKEYCHQDAKMYFNLVQSQMSTDELYVVCIDGLSSYGRKKMFPILNESSFLENLAIDGNNNIRKIVYFYYSLTKFKDITGIRNNVILIGGTEGTRKGLLTKMIISNRLPVRFTSITSILIRALCPNPFDYINNKDVLKKMLSKTLDPDDLYVINCDFCQLYKDGSNERLPLTIYNDINPIAVILLYTTLESVIQASTHRKIKMDTTLAQLYQDNEESCASDYADYKCIPLYRIDSTHLGEAIRIIKKESKAFNE